MSRYGRWPVLLVGVAALTMAGCGGDDDAEPAATTASAPVATTVATVAPTTAVTTVTTAKPTAPPTAGAAAPLPGSPCDVKGPQPDCIDPDEDGAGTYLVGGDECMKTFADDPGLCQDLDGDGRAGYPDSG